MGRDIVWNIGRSVGGAWHSFLSLNKFNALRIEQGTLLRWLWGMTPHET